MTEIGINGLSNYMEILPASRAVCIDGQGVQLTTLEFDVLYFLASNPNIAFTKEQIYEAVSKDDYSGGVDLCSSTGYLCTR